MCVLSKFVSAVGKKVMGWTTIYISGKEGFEQEVLKSLRHADIDYMPGSLGVQGGPSLFWLPESLPLREFKKAIGAKTVFRYRLQFFSSLEELEKSLDQRSERLSPREEAMIREMNAWQESRKYRHSA
jgi:hypothetical protein